VLQFAELDSIPGRRDAELQHFGQTAQMFGERFAILAILVVHTAEVGSKNASPPQGTSDHG
jgi:hypothetical protein